MRKRVFKYLKFSGIALAALFGIIYLSFILLMYVTENHWLDKEPFHDAIDVRLSENHQLTLIDNGIDSLKHRIDLIRNAQDTIELEFFIYELDESSRLITYELLQKAKQGVKIRLIVDFSFAVLELKPTYGELLTGKGVEVKYYNTSSISRFFSVQHRTHRKLLIVDDRYVILGGRNVANDYFDLSSHYNFLDSDLLVEGPIVEDIRKSFDLYWDSKWTVKPEQIKQEQGEYQELGKLLEKTEDLEEVYSILEQRTLKTTEHQCGDIRYITDYPGVGLNFRKVYRSIVEVAQDAREEILVESPYFVMRSEGLSEIENIVKSGVSFKVLTNSLGSTDAFYTVASLFPNLDDLMMDGFELYGYSGAIPLNYDGIPKNTLWGVHSKRAVIDQKTVLLGTYNIDPRSANLNSELMLICYDSLPLAKDVHDSISQRISQSLVVVANGESHSLNLIGSAASGDITAMFLVMPVANMFNFLL